MYVTAADFPAGEYRVVAITYRKCCKTFVLDNGAMVYCSKAKPFFQKYVPTDEDRSLGKYAIVSEKRTAQGEWDTSSTGHIVPLFGTNHLIDKSCWCGPTQEKDDEWVDFFAHASS